MFGSEDASYHGGHHPAHVDGVVSLQVVPPAVLLVLRTDLEQVHAGLQDARFILRHEAGGGMRRER